VRADAGADTKPDRTGIYTAEKIHLYHCDHRGLPLALVSQDGTIDWEAEYDAWGNVLRENNPHNLAQLSACRDSSSMKRRGCIITVTDIMTLNREGILRRILIAEGGWNLYQYPLNPVTNTDPLGLQD
jgi:YD repeat-containing protein